MAQIRGRLFDGRCQCCCQAAPVPCFRAPPLMYPLPRGVKDPRPPSPCCQEDLQSHLCGNAWLWRTRMRSPSTCSSGLRIQPVEATGIPTFSLTTCCSWPWLQYTPVQRPSSMSCLISARTPNLWSNCAKTCTGRRRVRLDTSWHCQNEEDRQFHERVAADEPGGGWVSVLPEPPLFFFGDADCDGQWPSTAKWPDPWSSRMAPPSPSEPTSPCLVTPVATDPDIYSNPETFDGFPLLRYERMSSKVEANRHQFATTGPESLAFGQGKTACPGRLLRRLEY